MYLSGQVSLRARLWLLASILLNGIGLASIAERLRPTNSILHLVVSNYEILIIHIHELIQTLFGLPQSLFLPSFASDILILLAGFFASANYYVLRSDGQSVFDRLRAIGCPQETFIAHWTCVASKLSLLYLAGPILFSYYFLKAVWTGRAYQRAWGFTFQARYIFGFYASIILIVFLANYLSSNLLSMGA